MTTPTPIQRYEASARIDGPKPLVHFSCNTNGKWVLYPEHLAAMAAAVPRWIPVSERMPPAGEWVLMYGPQMQEHVHGPMMQVWQWDGDMWWSEGGTELAPFNAQITHWMPLPQPPKETT